MLPSYFAPRDMPRDRTLKFVALATIDCSKLIFEPSANEVQIQARDPGITIWISPLNFYEGIVCDATGPDGPAIAAQAADWAASTFSSVQRGPNLGPLKPEHIGQGDNCHPNNQGELLLGGQLVAFFD